MVTAYDLLRREVEGFDFKVINGLMFEDHDSCVRMPYNFIRYCPELGAHPGAPGIYVFQIYTNPDGRGFEKGSVQRYSLNRLKKVTLWTPTNSRKKKNLETRL